MVAMPCSCKSLLLTVDVTVGVTVGVTVVEKPLLVPHSHLDH